ncbi:hypothetical protein TREMEDRAFT_31220 [Tremella mesenterica DSM 1558]|uniref:uncharacterized protein n=1 Tax=Tremella mesenterica (strain ATCC 24925 / CBS 8224 / DSM 1558 / NBRC 9311 / NRRL Y-6157 / RJB 2259-6 / UBC 559-6) TaxID=578456 RepID=UPI0003F4901A|nr:uncharacterized protein TREMEDRAFT_31220 [Tremella mesenterica DSM 1558]EIW69033.1 hypothetical protein TREMEDRAFT_31220 [Tremella mesenterica DSM 1558]
MVEEATTIDLLDANTRVTKTNYRLGWPSSPRDVVTISRTLVDRHTLIDITTSLPRSKHEPSYLRPAPPYVRAHINLLAWCIQLPQAEVPEGKAKITCFWSWNPKGAWAVGGGVPQHLPYLVTGLVDYAREGSEKVPVVLNFGPEVSIGSIGYDTARVTLSMGYAVVKGEVDGYGDGKRRQVEVGFSSTQSWDIQIHVKTQQGQESPSTVWTAIVGHAPPTDLGSKAPNRLILRLTHAPLQEHEELIRVKVSIERTSSSISGVRINGIPVTVESIDARAPQRRVLEETESTSGISLRSIGSEETTQASGPTDVRMNGSGRSQAAEKAIASMIKRNYIYFTSLLQEPEPKWKPVLDSRGVAIHQLDSIDKTLVVFRAEAVFVGVNIWDLYATIASPGDRWVWDKTHDDATLVEDINELTDLWHFRSKAAWPTSARDSVILRTTYKSPSSVHIFGFSVDDTELFPRIPPSIDPTVIRTQIDLQGWSIESLSPNTTQVTLLEQSDPRGWSNKSSIPQVMMNTLAGIGEFSIKHGAPPIATRLGGAKALSSRYDVEKETDSSSLGSLGATKNLGANIECEIRCDMNQWANSIAIVIDPPHQSLSALKRHKLSAMGGGLWLTIEHNSAILGRNPVAVTIRRGPPAVKPTLTANGYKVKIDTEELVDTEVQLLKRQRRSRPTRAPLDQPPALGTIRKKQSGVDLAIDPFRTVTPSTYAKIAAPLSRWYSVAAQQTRAAIVPMTSPGPSAPTGSTPVDAAVQALSQLARMHADRESESTDPHGWQPVSERDGLKVERRNVSHVSDTFPVFRAGRIIEGFTAEEVSAAVSMSRKDERFDVPLRLESYGTGIITSQLSAHTAFPFRGRSMLVATIVARLPDGPPPSPSHGTHTPLSTIFHASTSAFDRTTTSLDPIKYNPSSLPPGNVILEGWVLETIDPYSHENYAIPSTRCMYVAAVDFSGSMPLSVNNMLNASLPRVVLSVESMLKSRGPPTRCRLPPMSILAPEPTAQSPWGLEGFDNERVGVEQILDMEGNYGLMVLLRPSKSNKQSETLSPTSPPLSPNDSRSSLYSGRTVIDLGEDIRRGRKDLIVAEVVLATFLNQGCDISLRGISLPMALNSTPVINADSPENGILPIRMTSGDDGLMELPFKCQIIIMAPSVLQTASLEPTPSRHLVRITLPTAGYETPIANPLTGKTGPLPRPRWLLDLINDGAVVHLSITPRPGTNQYMFGEQILVVEEEKRSIRMRENFRIPQLVNRDIPNTVNLDKPLAVAVEYLVQKPVPPPPSEPSVDEQNIEEISTVPPPKSNGEINDETKSSESNNSSEQIVNEQIGGKYQFWRYPYPRLRRPIIPPPLPSKPSIVLPPSDTSVTDITIPTETKDTPTSPIRVTTKLRSRISISIPSLIVLCVACALIGSLLRSFLSESDFVIYFPNNVPAPEGGSWKELRRLAVWKLGRRRDLILAVARRVEG